MGRAAAALLILLLAACTPAPPPPPLAAAEHPLSEKIWLTREERFITPAELARHMAAARFVILGEAHDNPRHQAIHAWAVRALVESNRRPALVAEMIAADQAPALALYFAQNRLDARGLDRFLKWDQSGWPDWGRYKPLFDAAILGQMPIRAGNLDRTLLPAMHARGMAALPPAERLRLDLPDSLPSDVSAALARPIIDGHCGRLPGALVNTFVEIQYARDATLARALMDGGRDSGDGAVLITGAEHARRDRAVPMHLARLGNRDTVFTLGLLEVRADRPRPSEDADLRVYDAVWFTTAPRRANPCANIEQRLPPPPA